MAHHNVLVLGSFVANTSQSMDKKQETEETIAAVFETPDRIRNYSGRRMTPILESASSLSVFADEDNRNVFQHEPCQIRVQKNKQLCEVHRNSISRTYLLSRDNIWNRAVLIKKIVVNLLTVFRE
eukprot:g4934.t1